MAFYIIKNPPGVGMTSSSLIPPAGGFSYIRAGEISSGRAATACRRRACGGTAESEGPTRAEGKGESETEGPTRAEGKGEGEGEGKGEGARRALLIAV